MTFKARVKDMYTRVDGSGEGDNGFRYQPATQAEIDLAAGTAELRAQLAATEKSLRGYRSLSNAQQEVINEWREKLAALAEQRDALLAAARIATESRFTDNITNFIVKMKELETIVVLCDQAKGGCRMYQVTCPDCEGRGKYRVFADSFNEATDQLEGGIVMMTCSRCKGVGKVDACQLRWIGQGKELREARVHGKVYESISACAKRLGISVVDLSALERGLVDNTAEYDKLEASDEAK